MRAPTPISSLVHSSTLVVAGVYVLLQFRYCLLDLLEILKYISILTLLISRVGLLVEKDIKKLIAYSTLRHVSLLIFILRISLFKVVFFHLNIHAIFKSTIFMCFGFVILVSYHGQDKRLIRFINLNPILKVVYYYSRMCLIGLPFLSGFFSKDFIIEKVIEFNKDFYVVILLLLFLSVRVYYGIKLLRLSSIINVYSMVEKNYLGLWSVIFIVCVIMSVINVYIRLILRLRLELFSFKMFIYLLILFFFILRVITNLNFKFSIYDKIKNFGEI